MAVGIDAGPNFSHDAGAIEAQVLSRMLTERDSTEGFT
jgi:hypothetical protein